MHFNLNGILHKIKEWIRTGGNYTCVFFSHIAVFPWSRCQASHYYKHKYRHYSRNLIKFDINKLFCALFYLKNCSQIYCSALFWTSMCWTREQWQCKFYADNYFILLLVARRVTLMVAFGFCPKRLGCGRDLWMLFCHSMTQGGVVATIRGGGDIQTIPQVTCCNWKKNKLFALTGDRDAKHLACALVFALLRAI